MHPRLNLTKLRRTRLSLFCGQGVPPSSVNLVGTEEKGSTLQGEVCLEPLLKTDRDGKIALGKETGGVKTLCGAGS